MEIAHIGSDVTFKCAARGSPEPAIRWSKNGVELEEARDQEYLAYENVGEEHIGTYACNASNVAGYTYKVSCVDLNLIIILQCFLVLFSFQWNALFCHSIFLNYVSLYFPRWCS